jgi:hypothetical protein
VPMLRHGVEPKFSAFRTQEYRTHEYTWSTKYFWINDVLYLSFATCFMGVPNDDSQVWCIRDSRQGNI